MIEIVFELTNRVPAFDGFYVATTLRDFERRIDVFGGTDGVHWTPLTRDALIYDYTRFIEVANHVVVLPARQEWRWVKLVVRDVTDAQRSALAQVTRETRAGLPNAERETSTVTRRAFQIDTVAFWHNETRVVTPDRRKVMAYPVSALSVRADAHAQTTIIDLSVPRVPLTRLTLETTSANFNRRVRLMALEANPDPSRGETWSTLRDTFISSIRLAGYERSEVSVVVPEQRRSRYRLVVYNHADPPLAVSAVRAEGTVYEVRFCAAPQRRYRLYFGAADVQAPQYDARAVLAAGGPGVGAASWHLGARQRNPLRAGSGWCAWLNTRWTLMMVSAMTGVLALVLWRTARRVRNLARG